MPGYGATSNALECEDVDECSTVPSANASCSVHQATCVNIPGSFTCECQKGFYFNITQAAAEGNGNGNSENNNGNGNSGNNNGNNGNGNSGNNNGNGNSGNNGNGNSGNNNGDGNSGNNGNGGGSSSSSAEIGCLDVDECAKKLSTCAPPSSGGVCSNTIGSFSCSCASGYAGDGTTCTFLRAGPISSPQKCLTTGGTKVVINVPEGVPIGNGLVEVRFNSTLPAVAARSENGNHLDATCPPSPSSGPALGIIYLISTGEVIGDFEFAYAAPPTTVTPSNLPTSGGSVAVRVFKPVASGCTVSFGYPPSPLWRLPLPHSYPHMARPG